MIRYVIKRILLMIPVIWGVVTLIFLINTFAPGDPATQILGTSATEEQKVQLREDLGLNEPTIVQYFNYLKNIVLHGDMGISYSSKQSVSGEIASKYPTTMKLAGFCTIWSILVGVPMGIATAVKRYS
jgi:peptide/nickel transport system permease protein